MKHRKEYCLRCMAPGMGCRCKLDDKKFTYSNKLRVPMSTRNKALFRKFLDECPIFVNRVPDELIPDFQRLLRHVKYFKKEVNAHEWTYVTK